MPENINHKLPPRDAFVIDSEIASEDPCSKCGGNCEYDSHYEKLSNGSYTYRAFSVCVDCGNSIEF